MGNLIANLDFMLQVELIPRGWINCGGDGGEEKRLPFDQKFRCEFSEISIGEWYRSFQLTAPEWIPFAVLPSKINNCRLSGTFVEFIIDELMVDDDEIKHQSFEISAPPPPPPPNSGLSG